MADESGLSPYVFACEGGLVLDQPTFKMQPGMALELENFEPDVRGGYRRINGYIKWNSNIVRIQGPGERLAGASNGEWHLWPVMADWTLSGAGTPAPLDAHGVGSECCVCFDRKIDTILRDDIFTKTGCRSI